MAFYRVQVNIENDSVLARDAAVNVHHVESTDARGNAAALEDIFNAMVAFYTAIGNAYFSPNISGNVRVKIYDLEDAPPRVAVADDTFVITPASTVGLPNEVAIGVSVRGPFGSGVNRQRNSGRFYLGPLGTTTTEDGAGDMVVAGATRTSIANAMDQQFMPMPSPLAAGDLIYSVFSRYNALGLAVGAPPPVSEPTYTAAQLAVGFRNVVAGYVDNAFDTQRRRGLRSTLRTTFLI